MPEVKEMIDDFFKAHDVFKKEMKDDVEAKSALHKEKIDKIQDHLDKIELNLKTFKFNSEQSKENEQTQEAKAVIEFMRKGSKHDMSVELKAKLIAGDATQGGYLVHTNFETEIVKKYTELSPIEQYARVTTLSNRSTTYPVRTGLLTPFWVGEQGTHVKSASTYGQGEIQCHMLGVNVPISNDLLEDSFVNMETEIGTDVAEAFGQARGNSFVNGNGVNRPFGYMSNTDIVRIDTAASGVFASNDLYTLMFEPKSIYANNGKWFGNRKILREIRKFKGSDGQYLLPTIQQQSIMWNLLGTEFVQVPDMVEDVTTAGSQFLAFGDMFKCYRIVNRTGMSVLRDPYSNKDNNMVEFLFKQRVGGKVVLPEAMKILKVKA